MTVIRRIVALGLAVLGAYYAIHGSLTLLNLPGVTRRWIALSGDPDFRLDFEIFAMSIGLGAVVLDQRGVQLPIEFFSLGYVVFRQPANFGLRRCGSRHVNLYGD